MNVIVDEGSSAPSDAAVLRSARAAERLRASAVAKNLADQRRLSSNIVGEAVGVLDRLSKLAAGVGEWRKMHLGAA